MFINRNIYVDSDVLKKTIQDLHIITNMQIGVWDSDGNVFCGYPDKSTNFCSKINIDYHDRPYCHHCDQNAAFKCNDTLKPYSYICHAGAYELVIPLVVEKKCRMYIVLGQFVCLEAEEQQRQRMLQYCKYKNINCNELENLFDQLPRYSEKYVSAINNIVLLTFQSMWNSRAIEIRKDDILLQIDQFIIQNIASELGIKLICDHFHMSKNTLYSLFNEYYKMTVNNYITLKRIELAKIYLISSELTITEIAEKVGKKNYNDFIQTFKRYELISPYKYRQLHKIK